MREHLSETLMIECGAEKVPVAVEFRERRKLSISVHPDGSVTALAPKERSIIEVAEHLTKRRIWIAKQRQHFGKYKPLPTPEMYLSGETHFYLGRQYRLRITEAKESSVKLAGPYFHIHVPDSSDACLIADEMAKWYREHAEPIFRKRIDHCLASAPKALVLPVEMRIRKMKSRWGSCSRLGTITLNTDLVKAPLHCIDYVIMHELCHLREHNHGPAFYRLLGRCMPDWKQRKLRLDSFVLR